MSKCPKCGRMCYGNGLEFGPGKDLDEEIYDCDNCGTIWDEWGNAVNIREMDILSRNNDRHYHMMWFLKKVQEVGEELVLAGVEDIKPCIKKLKTIARGQAEYDG